MPAPVDGAATGRAHCQSACRLDGGFGRVQLVNGDRSCRAPDSGGSPSPPSPEARNLQYGRPVKPRCVNSKSSRNRTGRRPAAVLISTASDTPDSPANAAHGSLSKIRGTRPGRGATRRWPNCRAIRWPASVAPAFGIERSPLATTSARVDAAAVGIDRIAAGASAKGCAATDLSILHRARLPSLLDARSRHSASSMAIRSSAERSQKSWPLCFSWKAMPCFLTKATKSAGVNRDRADLAKRGFSLRKLAAVTSMLVKLARPPPEMRIFSATFSLWSSTKTFKPNWPATPAQNRPAAPAPTITTSKLCMGCSVYFQR